MNREIFTFLAALVLFLGISGTSIADAPPPHHVPPRLDAPPPPGVHHAPPPPFPPPPPPEVHHAPPPPLALPPPPPPSHFEYHRRYQLQEPAFGMSQPASPGWSIPSGTIGLLFGGATLGLSIATDMNFRDEYDKRALGLGGIILLAQWSPIVFVAGKHARGHVPGRGVKALRPIGWTLYGVSMATALMLSLFCIGGEDGFDDAPSQGIITATGAVAFTALLSLSIDTLVSGAQAIHANRAYESSFKSAQATSDRGDAFQWTVTATPVISGSNGVTGASMGIAGIF